MRLKNIIAAFAAGAMVITLAGCGSTQNTDVSQTDSLTQNTTTAQSSEEASVAESTAESVADNAATENVGTTKALIIYYDYSENIGDTSGMDADALTSASLAGEHIQGVERNNLLVIVEEIAAQTGADVFSVRTTETYAPKYEDMVMVAQDDQNNNKQFEFVENLDSLDGYDLIYIGMPVWWSKLPQPLQVFLERYDFGDRTIVPFGIHRGSRFGQMVSELKELAPSATVIEDGYTVNATTANDDVKAEVDAWLAGLGN